MVSLLDNSMQTSSSNELLPQQEKYLQDFETNRRRQIFEDILSKLKGHRDGDIALEWIFIGYKDGGENWREESQLYCECGRKLRYQYTLENKKTGLYKSFGLNHLTEHTGIPPESAREIVRELNHLTSERNELVKKWKDGWTLKTEGISYIPPDIHLPESILKPLRSEMPLLQHQVTLLKKHLMQHERTLEEKKLQEIVAQEKEQLKQRSLNK